MSRAKVWKKFSAKFAGHCRASFAVQNDPQNSSPTSSECITPCLVAERSKFHLRELLGFLWGNQVYGMSCQGRKASKIPIIMRCHHLDECSSCFPQSRLRIKLFAIFEEFCVLKISGKYLLKEFGLKFVNLAR